MKRKRKPKAQRDDARALVRILDHIFAFHRAAARSNQPKLIEQAARLQNECHDAAAKAGLRGFVATPNEKFNAALYRLADRRQKPAAGATIDETLAPGYVFKRRILRRAIVRLVEPGRAPGPSFSG